MRVVKPKVPIETQGRFNRMEAENEQLKIANADNEAALVELAELAAAQDDAIVELAEMIGG